MAPVLRRQRVAWSHNGPMIGPPAEEQKDQFGVRM